MEHTNARLVLSVVAVLVIAGCSKGEESKEKTKPSTAAKTEPKKQAAKPPEPPKFDRQVVLARLIAGASKNRCVEFEPAVQFLEDNVVRIQYIHGCGDFQKDDTGQVMWAILQACIELLDAAEAAAPTFKIQAFTRNGASLFTSVTSPEKVAKIKSKEMGFDDWLVRVGEGKKKLKASSSESKYAKALPDPGADIKIPEGDELKEDLNAYIEDIKCVDEVTKLVLGKKVTIGYTEGCGNFEDYDTRLTMYEIALRVIKQFDQNGVWAAVEISARTKNGGSRYRQKVPGRVLQGIKDRQVGIIDWVTQKY